MAKPISLNSNRVLTRPKPLPAALQKKLQQVGQTAERPTAAHVSDSFVPQSLKSPRPGSDMALMVGDLERNGALAPAPEPKVERPKPREGSDMAEMLANIDKQNTTFEHTKTHVNSNGTIALLEEPFMPQPPLVKTEKKRSSGDDADDVMSTGGVAIEGVEHAGNSAAAKLGEVAGEMTEQGAQMTSQILGSTAMEVAVQASAGLSGALVGPLLYRGTKKLAQGFKEGDVDKQLDGVNSLGVGARSGATAVGLANLASGGASQTLATAADAAAIVSPALGVVTAGIDGVLGVREILSGKDKMGGALRIGFAVGVGAAALGAGPVATAVAGGFLITRVGRGIKQFRDQRAAQKAATSPEQPPAKDQ